MSETDRILNDIRSYLRIAAAASLKPIATSIIDTQEKALVYGKMDGKTTQNGIAAITGIPQKTISNWAEAFVKAGLVSPPSDYYQTHKSLFSLNELGIDFSVLKKREKSVSSRKATSESDITSPKEAKEEEG